MASKAKKPAIQRTKFTTIGQLVNALRAKGKSTESILEAVMAKFPAARTSTKSIAWYRSKAHKK